MKRKPLNTRLIAMLLCGVILVRTLAGCAGTGGTDETKPAESESASSIPGESPGSAVEVEPMGYTRTDLEADLAEAKQQYDANTNDFEAVYAYAGRLYQNGDFSVARTVLAPMLLQENPAPEIVYLAADVEYLLGNYAQAESLYLYLVERHNEDWGIAAEAGLQMVYYQTNEYEKASHLFAGQDFNNPLLDMMKAFDDETPYQLDWNGAEKTVIPFVATDPLPVVPIDINGVRINAFIDTGAAMLIVDEAVAADLGIKPISSGIGEGGGGATDIGFSKTDLIKLGDVNIQNTPVMLTSFEGFSGVFSDITDVHAIIGTNVLQQFIPVMDYPSGQLILMPRDEGGKAQLNEKLEYETVLEEIPFVLAGTHYMFAKGSINSYPALNMFVDSGVNDDEAGIILSKETMNLLGILMPELTPTEEGHGGLAGSGYEQGWFDLSSYGLGNLQMEQGVGLYESDNILKDWFDDLGFVSDALISHNYLKDYVWTMDFDSMTMTFCEK